MSHSRPFLPPRLKDWTKGKTQIGVFVRTKEGGIIQATHHDATDLELKILIALGVGSVRKLSASLQRALLEELEALRESTAGGRPKR